jgi:hypothetical protein
MVLLLHSQFLRHIKGRATKIVYTESPNKKLVMISQSLLPLHIQVLAVTLRTLPSKKMWLNFSLFCFLLLHYIVRQKGCRLWFICPTQYTSDAQLLVTLESWDVVRVSFSILQVVMQDWSSYFHGPFSLFQSGCSKKRCSKHRIEKAKGCVCHLIKSQ